MLLHDKVRIHILLPKFNILEFKRFIMFTVWMLFVKSFIIATYSERECLFFNVNLRIPHESEIKG